MGIGYSKKDKTVQNPFSNLWSHPQILDWYSLGLSVEIKLVIRLNVNYLEVARIKYIPCHVMKHELR